jgi:putative exosortase-associated protein (TIGR04073 family)
MKKFALFLAVACVFSVAHAEAGVAEKMNSTKALDKFGRGVANIATGPGELLMQMPPAMDKSPDYITGFIVGLGRGIGYSLLRVGAGLYDVATCPFPGKTDYKPIMKPETIADKVAETTLSQTLPT